jgi:hypothetical protein
MSGRVMKYHELDWNTKDVAGNWSYTQALSEQLQNRFTVLIRCTY